MGNLVVAILPDVLGRLRTERVTKLSLVHAAVTVQQPEVTGCNFTALIATSAAFWNPRNCCCTHCTFFGRYECFAWRAFQWRHSRSERIGPLHGEASLANLRRVGRSDAGELRSNIVDDVEIAVGAIVVAKTEVGAGRLRVGGVHLKDAGEG